MGCRRSVRAWYLGPLALALAGAPAAAAGPESPRAYAATDSDPAPAAPGVAATAVPLDELPAEVRGRVRAVVERPTLQTRGPAETFVCQPPLYHWLLDHPDLAVRLWRCLGAKCTDIRAEGPDRFGWGDGQGSAVHWTTVLRKPGQRVWYAEGSVKPGPLLPAVPVRAVVVLHLREGRDAEGHTTLRHQVELTLHTDSHAAALAARLMGASAPRVAEQYVAQIEMFFAALAWYLDQYPKQAEMLFAQLQRPPSTDRPLLRPSRDALESRGTNLQKD
jgi:hypothetical protein